MCHWGESTTGGCIVSGFDRLMYFIRKLICCLFHLIAKVFYVDPALECLNALKVCIERLLVEALVVGDALRAVGFDDPGEGESIGEFGRGL